MPEIGDLAAIAEALCTNIRTTIPEMQAYDHMPDAFAVPAAVVTILDVDYQVTMDDSRTGTVKAEVDVLLARTDVQGATEELLEYLSPNHPKSVMRAIESDTTLGDTVSDLTCGAGRRGPAIQTGGNGLSSGTTYLTLIFDVTIYP